MGMIRLVSLSIAMAAGIFPSVIIDIQYYLGVKIRGVIASRSKNELAIYQCQELSIKTRYHFSIQLPTTTTSASIGTVFRNLFPAAASKPVNI
jgi:hypothetical protein